MSLSACIPQYKTIIELRITIAEFLLPGQKFNRSFAYSDDLWFDPTRNQVRLMMADAKPRSNRGRKPALTDSGRKRKKKETNALINRSRVYVGEQYDRWNALKATLRLQTHAEVAKVLLDRYVMSA
jgi:hypothetical protein